MALISVPLPTMSGGINRFTQEDAANQCSGIDIICDDGDVRRRDGFKTIAQAEPFPLPAGSTIFLQYDVVGGVEDSETGTAARCNEPLTHNRIYVGNKDPYDGLQLLGLRGAAAQAASANTRLTGSYYNGSDWVALPYIHDTTIATADGYTQSLMRDGLITWHRTQMPGWAPAALKGRTAIYWVRLEVHADAGVMAGMTMNTPGARCVILRQVNGISPMSFRQTTGLAIFSDRKLIRGRSDSIRDSFGFGAGGAIVAGPAKPPEPLMLSEDEGAAIFYSRTNSGPNGDWDVPADLDTGTFGSDHSVISKMDRSYEWLYGVTATQLTDQFKGAKKGDVPVTSIQPTGDEINTYVVTGDFGAIGTLSSLDPLSLAGCRFVVIDGATIYEAEIVRARAADELEVYAGSFPTDPLDPAIVCAVYAPPALVLLDDDRLPFEARAVESSGHRLFLMNDIFCRKADDEVELEGTMPFFNICRELRWVANPGRFWTTAFDRTSGRLFLTNGRSGLMEYDGRRLRRSVADTTSIKAEYYSGVLSDQKTGSNDPDTRRVSLLATAPPDGEYLVDYAGRIVVGNSNNNEVAWSAPGGYNDLWPLLYRVTIRDDRNAKLTGLATLSERLLAFTQSSVFEIGPPNDDGQMIVRQAASGVGFVGQQAVAKVSFGGQLALMGATPAGIAVFTGAELQEVLDRWERVIPGGVNQDRLDRSSACAFRQKGWFLLAVAARGSSNNNRILVFDYIRRRFWLWSAPFGASYITTRTGVGGKEELLVGTDDGHVMTLADQPHDDGQAIASLAYSDTVTPFGGAEGSFGAVMLTMEDHGNADADAIELKAHTDEKASARLTKDVGQASDQSCYGTATYDGGDADGTYGDKRYETKRHNLPAESRGHSVAYSVGGPARWKLRAAELLARAMGRRGR